MAEVEHALFIVSIRLCFPATVMLAGAPVALMLRTRAPRSVHVFSLGGHIVTLFLVQLCRVITLEYDECIKTVPMQNFLEISEGCWLHAICFNIFLSFRDIHDAREGHLKIILNMAYTWCIPLGIMELMERYIGSLYDAKVCVVHEGAFTDRGEFDASLCFALMRGISMLITAMLFIGLVYKTKSRTRSVLLCQDDVHCNEDMYAREKQVMTYLMIIVTTSVVELAGDLGAWYFRHSQSEIMQLKRDLEVTHYLQYQAGEWLCKSISSIFDFLRVVLLCELVYFGGPQRRRQSRDPLPSYEEAQRLPRLPRPPPPRRATSHTPPPPYSSTIREDVLLLETLEPTPDSSPVLSRATQCDSQENAPVTR